ncbi:MAG: magnesium transporter [Chloroflexi bacterium]|nr:magnesium transporter [Chloroflexota bacterium]
MEEPTIPEGDQIPGEALSIEERTREEVEQVLRLMGDGDRNSALALFRELHPVDQGEALLGLGQELCWELLADLTPKETAQVLEHLDMDEALVVTAGIDPQVLPLVLDETRPDVAADILRQLPQEQSQETLEAMLEAQEVTPLLGYADETAGGLMVPEFPVVADHMTAGIALDVLRLLGPDAEEFGSIFVVDDQVKLLGSITITRLALSPLNTVVREIMQPEIISVTSEIDQEECARLMDRYNLRHLPVVDQEQRLIGIIQVEDVVDVVQEEATEDMYRIAGIAGERVMGSFGNSVRSRLPWLYINLGTAFLAALVISFFESTIARVAVLAVFLPVVAGQGGIAGTQTLTLVVRGMALGEISRHSGLQLISRELLLGSVHGLLLAVAVGLVAYVWNGTAVLGVVVGAAMLGNMIVAGLAGSGVPLLLRRFNMDPAVSSVIFVTTFTDVLGFLFFLGLAAVLVESLV